MDLPAALDWLAGHINLEARPSPHAAELRLENIRRVLDIMGDPHRAYPAVHITGTNGKGSTARIATALLIASGLSVGTYTSPHLERVNERIAWDAQPIADDALAEVLSAVADLEVLLDERLTHFEILTAAALRWFADVAVDAAVIEVGLGGRYDATNVVDGEVAVVTNVSLDHAETIGPALTDIAATKAGIVKPGATLVLGETDPGLAPIFRATPAGAVWARGVDFGCTGNQLAVGGRALDLFTPGAEYRSVFLPAHGPFQGDNAAAALAAVQAFFGKPLGPEVVEAGLATVKIPGRLEVVGRAPLCVLDGAHNPAGARAAAGAVNEAFGTAEGRILVVGMLRGRDPAEMLKALNVRAARLVVACPPPSPRALPPDEVAAAALALGVDAQVCHTVEDAVDLGLAEAREEELVLVTGSLYVVGAARAWLDPE
ncbi:MAG: bifunctional folylpolyglutamate synthase/dihydrofolate synthase [Acidimicrobiia bacterium]